jgi:hypothetical protein
VKRMSPPSRTKTLGGEGNRDRPVETRERRMDGHGCKIWRFGEWLMCHEKKKKKEMGIEGMRIEVGWRKRKRGGERGDNRMEWNIVLSPI